MQRVVLSVLPRQKYFQNITHLYIKFLNMYVRWNAVLVTVKYLHKLSALLPDSS